MLKVTYNGKTYKDIGDAFEKMTNDAIKKGIAKMISEKLKQFESEIKDANGSVEIKFNNKDYNPEILMDNLPSELIERIKGSLS